MQYQINDKQLTEYIDILEESVEDSSTLDCRPIEALYGNTFTRVALENLFTTYLTELIEGYGETATTDLMMGLTELIKFGHYRFPDLTQFTIALSDGRESNEADRRTGRLYKHASRLVFKIGSEESQVELVTLSFKKPFFTKTEQLRETLLKDLKTAKLLGIAPILNGEQFNAIKPLITRESQVPHVAQELICKI